MSGTPAPLKEKSLEQVLKSVTVSDVEEHADCPETIYNVPIDLVKLENKKIKFYHI